MSVQASRLYQEYDKWCSATGETAETQRGFGLRMTERGFEKKHRRDGTYYMGIGLASNRSGQQEPAPF